MDNNKHKPQGRKSQKKGTERAQKICIFAKKIVKSLIKSNQSGFCDGSDSARKRLKILVSSSNPTNHKYLTINILFKKIYFYHIFYRSNKQLFL